MKYFNRHMEQLDDDSDKSWMFETGWDFGDDPARTDMIKWMDVDKDDKFSILDVGCASGKSLKYLRENYPNARLYGVEPDERLAKESKTYADAVSQMTIEEFAEAADSVYEKCLFDYILMGDVVEHLQDPWLVLRDIKKFLNRDGYLIASIPNVCFITVLINLLRGRFCYGSGDIVNKQHIRFFTLYEIISMFEGCGYTDIEYTHNEVWIPKYIKQVIEFFKKEFGENLYKQYEAYQYVIKAKGGK